MTKEKKQDKKEKKSKPLTTSLGDILKKALEKDK